VLVRLPCRLLHLHLSRWVVHHFSPQFTAIRHEAYVSRFGMSTAKHKMLWWVSGELDNRPPDMAAANN
jgi:hypothetical protein